MGAIQPITSTSVTIASGEDEISISDTTQSGKPNDDSENETMEDQQSCDTVSIKTLSEGHIALQANLQQATKELLEKRDLLRDLKDEVSRQQEKSHLLEERLCMVTEKLCCMTRALERREKTQDSLYTDIAEVKWKLHEATLLVEKLKRDKENFQNKSLMRRQEIEKMDGWESEMASQRQEIQEHIKLLKIYKTGLDNADAQLCAIRNGSKLMDLDQRKQTVREALNKRGEKCESMVIEIDEKTEKLEQLKKSLQAAEKQCSLRIKQLKNRLQCHLETQRRMQISNEYLQSKVDNGASARSYVPPMASRQVVLPLKRI
ncbi:unnamed protein product [Orchesella dallaii]|uniref:Uncharacterized protein n=1 Tax=Orchesella dallaii TaxID=48710 RepID=A0ABP1REM9_9HEXA